MYNHQSIKKWNINSEKIIYCLYKYFKKNIKKFLILIKNIMRIEILLIIYQV